MRLIFLPLLMLLCSCSVSEQPLVTDAWIRLPPPGSHHAAAYLSLYNGSGQEVVITAVDAPGFRHATIHRTVTEDGTSRMQTALPLSIDPDSRIEFTPGGLHVMLIDAQQPLRAEQHYSLQLILQSGSVVEFTAEVIDAR